jgi:malonyl-CoA/methylmalonyl-CoA synthetase
MAELPMIARASAHGERTAIQADGRSYRYADLLQRSASIAAVLLDGRADLDEERVAFMAPPGFDYAAIQWGIWRAGGIAVPLSTQATTRELEHVLSDSDAAVVVTIPAFAAR